MEIKYAGTKNGVLLIDNERGGAYKAKKGIPIEVPDELGEALLKRSPREWKLSESEKKKKTGKAKGTKEVKG